MKLGTSLKNGRGIAADEVEALAWFRKSAQSGLPEAQLALGQCYAKGWGVKKDLVEADAYFHLASINNEDARKERDLLKKKLSKEQIAAGQRRAKELLAQIESQAVEK